MLVLLKNGLPAFMTDHDFLGHFVSDFGLDPVISAHDSHDDHGSLKDLHQIEEYLQGNKVKCLLSVEPAPSKRARSLAQKYQLRIINIEPEIDTNSVGNGILRRLDQLTTALEQCRASS